MMESSFVPVENVLRLRASQYKDFQYQEILLTRLCVHVYGKLMERHDQALRAYGISEAMLMVLIALEARENNTMQPSELSSVLSVSRANMTRLADELKKRGWVVREQLPNDRRGLLLRLTEEGRYFLQKMLPPRYALLGELWSVLDEQEKHQLEYITRKVLSRLDQIRANSTTTQLPAFDE